MLRCENIAGRSYSCARCDQQPLCQLSPSREGLLLALTLIALLTIMMASCRDRSVSSMNCSAPPRRIIVQVFAFGQPVKKLYLPTHDIRRAKAMEIRLSTAGTLHGDTEIPSKPDAWLQLSHPTVTLSDPELSQVTYNTLKGAALEL